MKKIVIIPGGFHPYHAGHRALYDAAREAFPSADVFVAATDDTSERPFPFKTKRFLAQQAGIPGNRFIRVKSPFRAEEITQMYDPDDTQLIFVRSEKDAQKQPQPGGFKKDGSAAYLQPYKRNGLEPFRQHGYMAYLPTVQFGPGMTSATEIRAKWPEMSPEEKIELIKVMYPSTAARDAAAGKIVAMLDAILASSVEEGMAGAQASLMGAPAGSAPSLLNPTPTPMANAADRPRRGVRMGQEFDEATLINDPDSGVQIRPAGGMGTWDEASLVSNLARKFGDMVTMVKNKNYAGLHHALYRAGVVENMVRALAELEQFQKQQGRRPIARGREIDITDYVDERRTDEMGNPLAAIGYAKDLAGMVKSGEIKKYVEEARGPWYPKEFDNWQTDAAAYGFTIEEVPNPPTGQGLNAYYVKNRQGQIVGFFDGKSGNGVLTRTPQEYQAAISGQGMTAGGYAAYDKEVADLWKQVLPTIKKIATKPIR